MGETAYVALGSNLGDRDARLACAVRALGSLAGVRVRACSPVYETDPVGPGEQGPYLNAVVVLDCDRSPAELLAALHDIEARAGRRRDRGHAARWSARTLDLDLLFFGDAAIDEPDLQVPHPRIAQRSFVLVPLCDLAPDLVHPTFGQPVSALLARLPGAKPGLLPAGIRPWKRALPSGPPADPGR